LPGPLIIQIAPYQRFLKIQEDIATQDAPPFGVYDTGGKWKNA
jgi:hypothetical protein